MIIHEIKIFLKKDEHLPDVVVVGSAKKIIKTDGTNFGDTFNCCCLGIVMKA